ncbi:MAG TPA: GNAT family N-acetyltransferase [Dongiaceae bacterium]|nr:GNAT family N-acetyltransferase [Dongiaceae bacterium]
MPRLVIANRHPLTQPAAIVRAAGLREQAVVTDLLLRANRGYRKVLPARLYDAYVRDLRALAADWSDKDFLIAESDGALLGAVAFYRDASCQGHGLPREWAGLRALAVDPEARGRGIGRQLAEACVLRAWRMGRQVLALHCVEFQEVARKLYLSMGFQRCPQYDFDAGDMPGLDLKGERLAIDAFCLNLKR